MADTYTEYEANSSAFSDIDNLHSLAGGNIWQSEVQTQAEGSCQPAVRIAYYLHCDGSVADGETAIFRLVRKDSNSGFVDADLTLDATDDELSGANDIDDVQDQCDIVHIASIDRASQDVKGVFDILEPGPDWGLTIELDSSSGALEASGSAIYYQYFQPGDGS